jgi:hypothetical protein
VPSEQGQRDNIRLDESKNLIVVPMPYDGAFMEVFYGAWEIVLQVMARKAEMPREVELHRPAQRIVARNIVDRRDHPVNDIVEALGALAQPYLLSTRPSQLSLDLYRGGKDSGIRSIISPIARKVDR